MSRVARAINVRCAHEVSVQPIRASVVYIAEGRPSIRSGVGLQRSVAVQKVSPLVAGG
jgi:hypothetical protein